MRLNVPRPTGTATVAVAMNRALVWDHRICPATSTNRRSGQDLRTLARLRLRAGTHRCSHHALHPRDVARDAYGIHDLAVQALDEGTTRRPLFPERMVGWIPAPRGKADELH